MSMNITSTLYMARESLLNEMRAISVTSHNMSNVNTAGYSRQRSIFMNREGIMTGAGTMGARF